jgi:RHS repeat-associated protein
VAPPPLTGTRRTLDRDALGRVARSCLGTTAADCFAYTYDALGHLTAVTDPLGHETTFTPGHLGRVSRVVAADGGVIGYDYDAAGNLVSLVDPNGHETTYEYGPLGELLEETRPGNRTTAWGYDGKRRLRAQTLPSGATVAYAYDEGGVTIDEVTSIDYSDGRSVDYRRDASGNILGETDSLVGGFELYTATYDALDRVDTLRDNHAGLRFDYDYHPNAHGGNLASLTLGDALNATQTYAYDAQGRLTGVGDSEGGQVSWTLSAAGRIATLSLGSGGVYTYTYDGAGKGRLVSISGPAATISYTYDAAGNVRTRTVDGRTEVFSYDEVNRLTVVDAPGSADDEAFGYDQAGNRISSNGETWAYNERNELTRQGAIRHHYDANGNVTMTVDGAVSKRYFWNAADQLTAYTNHAAAVSATYAYDSSGRRVRKVVWSGGVSDVTRFVWEGPRLLAELDGQGAPKRRYVYRGFTPLAMVEYGGGAPVPYFYVTDALGTPWKLVDASGAVVWSASYKAFGEATVSGVVEQPLRFPGQYYDTESGLHYNYKRYYEPGAGRYFGRDALLEFNGFLYAYGNPFRFVDPTGLISLELIVPEDRSSVGVLTVYDDFGDPRGYYYALARGNHRNPLEPNGDTPTGLYTVVGRQSGGSVNSYGPHDRLQIDPIGGQALDAAANGRKLLRIHGGDRHPAGSYFDTDDRRRLKSTFGCIRLSNEDMESLLKLLDQLITERSSVLYRVSVRARHFLRLPVDGERIDLGVWNLRSTSGPDVAGTPRSRR